MRLTDFIDIHAGGPGSGEYLHVKKTLDIKQPELHPIFKKAIFDYQSHRFRETNAHLRGEKTYKNTKGTFNVDTKKAAAHAALVESAVQQGKAQKDLTLFRGSDATWLKNAKVGDTIAAKQFLSTTSSKDIAEMYNEGALLTISVPKGSTILDVSSATKGMDLTDDDEAYSEHEKLLSKDAKFKVVDIKGSSYKLELVSKKSIKAGGPGSGKYLHIKRGVKKISTDPLRSTKREEQLLIERKKKAEEKEVLKRKNKSIRGRPITTDKQKKALASVVTATKEHQDKAERVEQLVTKYLGGEQSANNKPFDVTTKVGKQNYAVEVKTLLLQTNDKITMKKDAIERKHNWAKETNSHMLTVAVDARGVTDLTKAKVYYRQGVGAFRIGSMLPVKGGMKGLKSILTN